MEIPVKQKLSISITAPINAGSGINSAMRPEKWSRGH